MINHILKECNKGMSHYREIPMDNASVTKVVFDDGCFNVVETNIK